MAAYFVRWYQNNTEEFILKKSVQRNELSLKARTSLDGCWIPAVGVSAILLTTMFVVTMISGFFGVSKETSILFPLGIRLILLNIAALVFDGALCFFRRLMRTGTIEFTDILLPFQKSPDRFLAVSLVKTAAGLVCYAPLLAADFGFMSADFSAAAEMILLTGGTALYTLFLLVFSQSEFLLPEDDHMSALTALRNSALLMRGKKKQLFLLLLPFIGYILLSVLTLGVGFLWVLPYFMCTLSEFHESCIRH